MTRDDPYKPHTVQGGSGTAWLAAAGVGCIFAMGMAWMIRWGAGGPGLFGNTPAFAITGFWAALVGLAAVCVVYGLTVASRRRPATYGVEVLTIAERRRLEADDDDIVSLSETAAA